MLSFQASTWADVEALRARIQSGHETSAEDVAQSFASSFSATYETVVLARVFVVLPFSRLAPAEQVVCSRLVAGDTRLNDRTPVLVLLGTSGRLPDWNDRRKSVGHRAIPLLSADHVNEIPMVANLLASIDVDYATLANSRPISARALAGGKNRGFFVEDARTTADLIGRRVIPAEDFVRDHHVRTVFGMGGAYAEGGLAIAIVFTSEIIERMVADRFPSLISNFKIMTRQMIEDGRIFGAPPPPSRR